MDTRKQIAERLGTANNVLVTVSADPTVDQLAACIGLTLALNKLGKHSTAVFSGHVPDTLDFLKPDKTIEKTADSLRDFIIALDKSKADKLRYKVEDKVVKIFITPYKTSLTEEDLAFSQGDFNVDVVMALGVAEQRDLDQAITAHGRILHDATVVSLNTSGSSELGSLNWVDGNASCLSEMVAALLRDLGKKTYDNQIATALLTGIVAATDRFRNERTTARSLSISSDLMSAGANQQLITSQLDHQIDVRQAGEAKPPSDEQGAEDNTGTLSVEHEGDESGDKTDQEPAESTDEAESALPPEAPEMPELPEPEAPEEPKVHRVRGLPDQDNEPGYTDDSVDTEDEGSNDRAVIDSNQLSDQLGGRPRSRHKQKLLSHDKPVATEQPKPVDDDITEPASLPPLPDVPEPPKPTPEPPKTISQPEPPVASVPEPEDPAKIPDMWSDNGQPSAGLMPPPDLPVPPKPSPMPAPAPVMAPQPPKVEQPAQSLAQLQPSVPPIQPPVSPAPEPKPAPAPAPLPVPEPPKPAPAEPKPSAKPQEGAVDVDAARAEVMRALSEAPDDDRPEPLQAINAQPLGDSLHQQPAPASSLPTPSSQLTSPVSPSQPTAPTLSPSPVGPPPTPAATPMDMPMPGPAAPAQAPPQPSQNLPFSTASPFSSPAMQRPATPGNLLPAPISGPNMSATPPPPVPPPMLPPTPPQKDVTGKR